MFVLARKRVELLEKESGQLSVDVGRAMSGVNLD